MPDPYGNRDEKRPFGEGTPVPEHELARESDGHAEFFALTSPVGGVEAAGR